MKEMIVNRINNDIKIVENEWLAVKEIIEKYYNKIEYITSCDDISVHNKTCWVCWFQGSNDMPLSVRKCIESMQRHIKKYDIRFISFDNLEEYVDIPNEIMDMLNNNEITLTMFSDLVRLELLYNHGGLWLDATMYCTGDIPDYVSETKLFAYQFNQIPRSARTITSGFIYAKKNNPIIGQTLKIMYDVIKNEKNKTYFMMHYIFRMVTLYYEKEWENVPFYPNANLFILSKELDKEWDEHRYEAIKKLSNQHYISYKKTEIIKGSMLEHLLTT